MSGGISGSAVVSEENRILTTLRSSHVFYEVTSLCHIPLFLLYIWLSARSISGQSWAIAPTMELFWGVRKINNFQTVGN
jgi:hypothetical protein